MEREAMNYDDGVRPGTCGTSGAADGASFFQHSFYYLVCHSSSSSRSSMFIMTDFICSSV